MNLRLRLLMLVVFATIPPILLTLRSGFEQRSIAAESTRAEALRVAQVASANQDAVIEGAFQLLTSLAQLPQLSPDDPQGCSDFLQRLVRLYQNYTSILVALPDGEVFCTSVPGSAPININDYSYYSRLLSTRQFTAGQYTIGRLTQQAQLPFAYPVLDDEGQVSRIIVAGLSLDWLLELTKKIDIPEGGALIIVDNHGTILSRYPNPEQYVGKTLAEAEVIQEILVSRGEGYTEVPGLDGISRLYAFTPLHEALGETAYVSVGIRTQTAYGEINRNLITNLVALGLVSVLSILLAVFISDYFVVRPVSTLLQATRRVQSGDLSTRVGIKENYGEISQLADSFDRMAENLQQRSDALEQAEARYRTLVEQIPAITYTASLEPGHCRLYISPQIENVLGFLPGEWVENCSLWTQQIHPEDCTRVVAELDYAAENLESFYSEYRVIASNGNELWVRDEALPVYGEDGKPLFMQGILLDITQRKRFEASLQNYAIALERSNRELQDFAYIASHDLQEPLRKIQAFGERLTVKHGESMAGEAQDYLQRMVGSASRMQVLINDLLAYSRISTKAQPHVRVDLNRIVAEVVSDLGERLAQTGGRVEVEDLPEIEADSSQMRQLFQNLIGNALKFHLPDVPPHVKVYSSTILDRSKPRSIDLIVEDNGIGFDEKYLSRIFQPFQRLHSRESYEGSGIGLAICRKIVERHGGSITAVSEPGQGAKFVISLPVMQPTRERSLL